MQPPATNDQNREAPNRTKWLISQWLADFPRQHMVIAGCTLVALTFTLLLPSEEVQANRISQSLTLGVEQEVTSDSLQADAKQTTFELPDLQQDATFSNTTDDKAPATNLARQNANASPKAARSDWQTVDIRNGDNLSLVFQRAGLSASVVHEVTSSSKDAAQLKNIFPGQQLAFQTGDDGQLLALRHTRNQLQSTLYTRADEGFRVEKLERQPEVRQAFKTSTINSSLYIAARDAGLQLGLIMEMADIFSGVVDFVYDVQRGDTFSIVYEEHYLDDKKIGNGKIISAQFVSSGTAHNAYRYIDMNGDIGYYNEDGESMRKAFLRAPLDFTRISSNFNLQRLHPIFKINKPHRGIDYAAATGTPVYAAGDGRVISSGYTAANGNYVVIQHGDMYTTKYLHLNKRNVRAGQRVKQRHVIGTVGATGYATGPHLHYEFLMNGVHRNPRTIVDKLPKAISVASAEKSRFLAQIRQQQTQLAALTEPARVARLERTGNPAL